VVDLPEAVVCREEELVRGRVEQLLGREEEEPVVVGVKSDGAIGPRKDRLTNSMKQTQYFLLQLENLLTND
jgi:hypothetical protein